jgi:hypothetical protein
MQHASATAWSPASDRKIYVVWIGVVWAAILAGFGMDFARYVGEAPPPPFILHVHAAVYVLWLGLVTLQILWVEMGNLRRHKQLGWLTVAVSVLMVPLGLAAALVDQVRQVTHPDYAPQFLALEFEEMITFSAFMIAGVVFRRNPAAHKRLMLLSAVAILTLGLRGSGSSGSRRRFQVHLVGGCNIFGASFSFSSPWGLGTCGAGDAFIQRCYWAQPCFGQARSSQQFSIFRQHGAT